MRDNLFAKSLTKDIIGGFRLRFVDVVNSQVLISAYIYTLMQTRTPRRSMAEERRPVLQRQTFLIRKVSHTLS